MGPLHQRPSKIVCVGRNYRAHARELGNEVPATPMLFLKPPSALIGPGDPIVLPAASTRVEQEAEIGVVIGRALRRATESEAEAGIGGFICANDVTARDLQRAESQWGRAKGFDTFCPVGPAVVPGLSWQDLTVICRVNGEERQRAPATDMVFPIPFLLAWVSAIMTLEPGDLLLTGTPSGTAPLAAGDVVEAEIPGVGVLRNPVIEEAG